MRFIGLAAMLVLAGAAPLRADAQQVECRARMVLGGKELTAGASASGSVPNIAVGEVATVHLLDGPQVRFVLPLAKPLASGDKGGLLMLRIVAPGIYRIALGQRAWIDVARAGLPIESTAHAHGAPCSGIAKMVDFSLMPGDYIIQLSDTVGASIGISVTKQP